MPRRGSGQQAERRAVRHYRLRGYRILGVNVWSAGYELDLIVRRGRRLVFCEVKSKSGAAVRQRRSRWSTARSSGGSAGPPKPGSSRNPSLRALRISFDVVAVDEGRPSSAPPRRSTLSPEVRARRGTDAGSPLRRHRPRALLVRAGPARARAHEARQPAAPVPRQVHPAARRDAPRSATCRRAAACSTRSPARGRRSCRRSRAGYDATGVDIAAFNALLMRVKTERYNLFTLEHELRDACARLEALEPKRPARGTPAYVRRLVRAGGCRPAAAFPFVDPGLRARGRAAGRARARSALGAPDDALRPRLPARASARAVLVPQAQARVPPRRSAQTTSCAATRSTRSHASRRSPGSARAGGPRACCTATRASSTSAGRTRACHVAAVSGPDRLPRAAPLRVRAARPRRPRDVRARSRRDEARDRGVHGRRRRACSSARRSRCAAARAWSSS